MCSVWALSKQHSGIKCWCWHCFPPQAVNSSETTTWSDLSVAEKKDHLPSLMNVARSMGLSDSRAETHLHRTMPKIPFIQWGKRELPALDPAKHTRLQVAGQVVCKLLPAQLSTMAVILGWTGKNRAEKIKKERKLHPKASSASAEVEVNKVRTRRDLWTPGSSICLSQGFFLWPHTNCGSLAASPLLCNENDFIHRRWCHEIVVRGCDSMFV